MSELVLMSDHCLLRCLCLFLRSYSYEVALDDSSVRASSKGENSSNSIVGFFCKLILFVLFPDSYLGDFAKNRLGSLIVELRKQLPYIGYFSILFVAFS